MSLIIKKFGGTSVADKQKLFNVADIIIDDFKKGNDVIAVVSAQGDFTDVLVEKSEEISNGRHSKRETDMLLSAGEQISAALLAMAIEERGCHAVSLLGWQAGFITDSTHTSARIKDINTSRITAELSKHNIVIVAGFQGVNKYDDITTLGRGGSDTSAVALAARFKAGVCQIYTDVDGVYTADPRCVKDAKKIEEITYDEMLELASLGAQVLNNRSVEMAKKYNVELQVLSSREKVSGTTVKEMVNMENMVIRGVAKDTDISTIYITSLKNSVGLAYKVFDRLAQRGITVDTILQTAENSGKTDFMFSVKRSDCEGAVEAINSLKNVLGFSAVKYDNNVAKISIVGIGISSHPGVAAKMFEALCNCGIDIKMISSAEIKISVIVEEKDADLALNAVHKAFLG